MTEYKVKVYENSNAVGGVVVQENEPRPSDDDERVSLAPLTPEDALRGLLATPRADEDATPT